MDHREAKRHLLDFVAGDLDTRSRSAVTSHIEECVDCRAWLETHDLLASASEMDSSSDHPDSELLALCAVRPEEGNEPGRAAVRRHLESCARCRREIELVRDAVMEARPEAAGPAGAIHPKPSPSWWRAAAAACVVAVALGWLTVETRRPGHVDSRPNDTVMTMDELLQTRPDFPGEEISGVEIEGTRLIEADGNLTLNQVKIKDGARVTIRTGGVVAFGNGFQIAPQAQLIVEVSPGDPAREYRGSKARKEESG